MAGLKARLALWVFVGFYLFYFTGCAPRVPASSSRTSRGIYHVVQSGENLFRIGKAYDISYQDLARINHLRDPHQIHIGQRIFIPGATRQLPVEIITPLNVTLEIPSAAARSAAARDGFIWPVRGSINSHFGPRGSTFHDGIDISAPEGTPIRAVATGEVIYSDRLRGYGNLVIIRHQGAFATVYAHNRINLVREGQTVSQGDIIAEVGSTGRVTAPHLHFEIRQRNVARDPLHYLPRL